MKLIGAEKQRRGRAIKTNRKKGKGNKNLKHKEGEKG
jgi:hypothetical protein